LARLPQISYECQRRVRLRVVSQLRGKILFTFTDAA